MKKLLTLITLVIVSTLSPQITADDHATKSVDYMPSLITKTPLEGRMLAITIVRKTIGTIQTDGEAKHVSENYMLRIP